MVPDGAQELGSDPPAQPDARSPFFPGRPRLRRVSLHPAGMLPWSRGPGLSFLVQKRENPKPGANHPTCSQHPYWPRKKVKLFPVIHPSWKFRESPFVQVLPGAGAATREVGTGDGREANLPGSPLLPSPLPSPFSPPLAPTPLPSPQLGPGCPAPSPPSRPRGLLLPRRTGGASGLQSRRGVRSGARSTAGPPGTLGFPERRGTAGRQVGRCGGGVGEEKGAGGQQPRVPAPPRPLAEPSLPCGWRAAQRAWLQRGLGASDRAGAGEARLPQTTAGRAGGEGAGGDLVLPPAGCGEGVRPSRAPHPHTLLSAGRWCSPRTEWGWAPAWGSGEAGWPARGARSRRPSGSARRGSGPAARVWFPFGAASVRGSGARSTAARGSLRAELTRPRSPGAEPARAACALRPQGGAERTDPRLGGGKARLPGDLPSGCRPRRPAPQAQPRSQRTRKLCPALPWRTFSRLVLRGVPSKYCYCLRENWPGSSGRAVGDVSELTVQR